jgi:hypothetical protein
MSEQHFHARRDELIEEKENFDFSYRSFVIAASRTMNGSGVANLPDEWSDAQRLRWAIRYAEGKPVDVSAFMDDLLSLMDKQAAFISHHPCRKGF